jgi:CelD/BcsL family acetyltransferase involved in cellulose biosynthesis
MVYFVGSGGSDYLDFVGDLSDPEALTCVLRTARDQVPNFAGFRFYHVPDTSNTGRRLAAAAARLGLCCRDEGGMQAPWLDLAAEPRAADKKRLIKCERSLEREGPLETRHFRHAQEILPQLDDFFRQHMARWDGRGRPSQFHDPTQQAFVRRVVEHGARAGWLRFTRLDWCGSPIAFHLGFSYRGTYLFYKPTFAVEFARRSPGQVLLRRVLAAAVDEGATRFDFGLGDEAYKRRFTANATQVRTWALLPTDHSGHA